MSETPRRRRGRETVGDMVRSLAVVLVVVFAVVALTVRQDPSGQPRRIDYSATLAQARSQAPYDVLAPVGLPRAWRATSARTGPEGSAYGWHLGLVTPAGDYAGVEQSNAGRASLVDSVAAGATRDGRVRLGGRSWQRLTGGSPEKRALVLGGAGSSTVVAGSASWAELRRLAGALSPR